MRTAAMVAVASLIPALAAARRPAPPRYHLVVAAVDAVPQAPAEITVKTKAILAEILASRPEFVTTLEGAPDPSADADAFARFLAARHIDAISVTVKIDRYDRTLAPNDKPGKSGQVLTIGLNVSLVGTRIPGKTLALAGTGGAKAAAEVGARLLPNEEEATRDEVLRAALAQAVDGAVTELRRPPPKAKPKKHR